VGELKEGEARAQRSAKESQLEICLVSEKKTNQSYLIFSSNRKVLFKCRTDAQSTFLRSEGHEKQNSDVEKKI
jgi:hypothetical protein